jgi:hypothetical protein
MDPVAALEALDSAMYEEMDREAVAEYADALVHWLSNGGFRPVGPHGADWRGSLTDGQLLSHFRALKQVANLD